MYCKQKLTETRSYNNFAKTTRVGAIDPVIFFQCARDLGLTLDPVETPPRILHVRGRNYVAGRPPAGPPPFQFSPEERSLGMAGVFRRYLGDAMEELAACPPESAVPETLRRYDELTMAGLLEARGASPGLIARPGWMEGALESGLRAAREVESRLLADRTRR